MSTGRENQRRNRNTKDIVEMLKKKRERKKNKKQEEWVFRNRKVILRSPSKKKTRQRIERLREEIKRRA
ncbi:unnamed protein product [Lasius platythorax]|uniref:Uncharacterized protein n=1 Tax=Lasius platythorax TaxID=488582 RepID=A0AAV2MYB7_9HYME